MSLARALPVTGISVSGGTQITGPPENARFRPKGLLGSPVYLTLYFGRRVDSRADQLQQLRRQRHLGFPFSLYRRAGLLVDRQLSPGFRFLFLTLS